MSNVITDARESTSNEVAYPLSIRAIRNARDQGFRCFDSVNQDCCGLCGMSGLEMLQAGTGSYCSHICDPVRIGAHQKNRAWDLWRWQAGEMR